MNATYSMDEPDYASIGERGFEVVSVASLTLIEHRVQRFSVIFFLCRLEHRQLKGTATNAP